MRALSAKEIGYLEDHFIESVTQNWHYFRFSPSSSPCETEPYNKCLSYFLLLIMNVLAEYRIELMQGKTVLFPLLQLIVKRAREEGSFFLFIRFYSRSFLDEYCVVKGYFSLKLNNQHEIKNQ